MSTNDSWRNAADVTATWDQLSLFNRGQPKLDDMTILSAKNEDRLRYKEAKRMESEILKREKMRLKREKEKLIEDQKLEEQLLKDEWLARQTPKLNGGLGRAQMIQDIRRKVVGSSANQTDIYIREQVRKTAGYYGNDMIEKYWCNNEGTEESTSTSPSKDSLSSGQSKESFSTHSGSESEGRWTPAVDDQFEDASSLSETDCVINANSYVQDLPTQTQKPTNIPPRNRNALINSLMQKNSNLFTDEAAITTNDVPTEVTTRNHVWTEATTSIDVPTTVAKTSRSDFPTFQEESRCVYTSSAKTLCPSKFTFPSLYKTSFLDQWSPRNRKLNPSHDACNEFIESKEFKLDNNDFPPL